MKDTKHIRRDFHSVPWVMPQGWDFGALGAAQGVKKNSTMVMWYIKSTGMTSRTECIIGSNWWPRGEVKGQISLNFGYHVNVKDFYTKLCVFSHKWKIQTIFDGIFILLPGSCPWGGALAHWGCPGVIFFQTWSCGISNCRGWQAEQNASNFLS